MWSSPSSSALVVPAAASVYGDINGVRLTKLDELQQYAQESLSTALDSVDAGRHVARVAHLYLARNLLFHLQPQDWEVNIIALCRKLFGPLPSTQPDFGWFGQISQLNWLPQQLPHTWEQISNNVDLVFAENRTDSDHLKALRIVQLLHPKERLNFFQLAFLEPGARPNYAYLFPTIELSSQTQEMLAKWHAGRQAVQVPELFLSVCGENRNQQTLPAFLQLSLPDWYTFRFLNWFAQAAFPVAHRPQQPQHHLPNFLHHGAAAASSSSLFGAQTLKEAVHGKVHLDLLSAYMDYFFSSATEATARQRAIFRWSISELWLSRPNTAAQPILLDAVRILILHIGDSSVLQEAFSTQLVLFLLTNLREGAFEESFPVLCALIQLFLRPWQTKKFQMENAAFVLQNAGYYSNLLRGLVDRFDAESKPSLHSMECFLALFDAKTGVFSNEVFALLCTLEGVPLPQVVRNCHETTDLLKQVEFPPRDQDQVNLSAVRVQLANVVREIAYKLSTAGAPVALAAAALMGQQRKHTRENLERLSALFDVPIPQPVTAATPGDETRTSSVANLYASPERARTSGVPTWISNATSSGMQFLALTATGKQQILDGTRAGTTTQALQYVGDYAHRPVERFEIPALVWLVNRAEWGAQARSIVADSRNLFWLFLLLGVSEVLFWGNGGGGFKYIVAAVYCMGAGELRKFALVAWTFSFVALWLASFFRG